MLYVQHIMERNNLPSLQINIATVIHMLLLISLVPVKSIVVAADEKLQHKSLISKSEQFDVRPKRSENAFQREYLTEYYARYYNDYYSEYYSRFAYNNVPEPVRKSIGSVGSFNDNLKLALIAHGTEYMYTPLFKYRSTHRKRHKLFVPV